MGKTADQRDVQKTVIDILHKEGEATKYIAQKAGFSQNSLSICIDS